jgi:NADPH-dependent glutamate synthase beta subunit-like oxidoreductase
LPKKLLDEEISHVKDLGVKIKTNAKVGRDFGINELWKQGFNAILISVGAHKTRKLGIEGEDLPEVFDALDFLRKTNSNEQVKIGQHVIIIGGGNVAIDSARTAHRLGAKEVIILYRRSKDEMPANPYEIKEAEDEDIKIQFLVAPKRILGQNGHVNSVECLKMKLGEPDETGRRASLPIEGSEFTIQTDSVILAIGESPDVSSFSKEIETDGNAIAVEPYSTETSQPGIFAAGDCVSGPATFIQAILAGKKAAESIDHYLQGERTHKAEQILERRTQT